jgi:hypothetical protein
MAPTNKDSGAMQMAGAHIFQAVQHPELDTLGLVNIRDSLTNRERYSRLAAQNNKADGVNVTSIALVCYAVLRMRTLSISYAEHLLVISCGKVESDKSSYRND